MLSKLLLSASQKLTERVIAAITLPALGFWFVGVVVLFLSPTYSLVVVSIKSAGTPLLLLWAAALLGAIVISAGLVSALAPLISKLLLGEWPHWFHRLQAVSVARKQSMLLNARAPSGNRWPELSRRLNGRALAKKKYARTKPRNTPCAAGLPIRAQIIATKAGNLLRAAASRITGKYGLEAAVVWPRLELVIPAQPCQVLNATQEQFREASGAATWSAILPLWVIAGVVWGTAGWRLWMLLGLLPASLCLCAAAYQRCVLGLEQFGETLESLFDLFRTDLYRSLRFPLPPTPEEELISGATLTAYLLRGSHSPYLRFTVAEIHRRVEEHSTEGTQTPSSNRHEQPTEHESEEERPRNTNLKKKSLQMRKRIPSIRMRRRNRATVWIPALQG